MKVRIYKPAKSAMQSGRAKTGQWVLEYETISKRQPEPLMGWCSSNDTLNQVLLKFDTVEQAVAFAEDKGWDYSVATDHIRKVRPRNYVDNFVYRGPAPGEEAKPAKKAVTAKKKAPAKKAAPKKAADKKTTEKKTTTKKPAAKKTTKKKSS